MLAQVARKVLKKVFVSPFEIISNSLSFRNMSVALTQDSRPSQDSSKRFMRMIDPVPLHMSASSKGILKAKWEARTFKTGAEDEPWLPQPYRGF